MASKDLYLRSLADKGESGNPNNLRLRSDAQKIELSINVSDTVTITESVVRLVTSFVSVSDSITITENVVVSIEAGVAALTVNVSDTVTITESIGRMADENIRVSDTVTITESLVLLIPTLFITVSDTVTITESIGTPAISYGIDVEPKAAYTINGVKVV